MKRNGLGFVFAPSYHPAFKAIGPVRRGLADRGIPSVFNLLGPLLNPIRPSYQLTGIYAANRLRCYAEVLQKLGRTRAWTVHGSGADELTLAGPTKGFDVQQHIISEFSILPHQLNLPTIPLQALRGGERDTNAAILVSVLDGSECGSQTLTVALNAAAGFLITGVVSSLPEGIDKASELIQSGAALAKLRAMQSF